METRGFAIERRDVDDDGRLPVSGTPVVFGAPSEDMGGWRERFASGSLTKTLAEQHDIGLLYSHDTAAVLASLDAGNLRLAADDAALSMQADLDPADPDVARLAAKMDAGTVRKMSFGFRAVREQWDDEGDLPIRTVLEAQLLEVSAVWLPAYPSTSLVGRTGLADVPVGMLAAMPAEVRARILTPDQVDEAIEQLRALKPTPVVRLAAARRLAAADYF